MISFDLNFFPREDTPGDEYGQFDDCLTTFIETLWRHGNIVGEYVPLELEDCVQVRVVGLSPDALDEPNLNAHALNDLEKVRALSAREPELRRIEEKTSAQTWCDCESPSFRLLYSHWDRVVSPVLCGDCWRGVPLYHLPLLEPEQVKSHEHLTQWLNHREDFEMIWLYSGAGEREAYRQLARPRSPFMKSTRELAAQLEAKTNVPTFAFLKHYYEKWGERCPLCERKWKWKGPHKLRYRCDHCRLLSEKPTDYRTPLAELHR